MSEPESFPVNLDAERSVLGAVIDSPDILSAVLAEGLESTDFALNDHRRMWAAISNMSAQGLPVDLLSLCDCLGDDVAILAMAKDLTCGVILLEAHILHHVRIVKRKARLRALLSLSEWLAREAVEVGADPDEIVKLAYQRLEPASVPA